MDARTPAPAAQWMLTDGGGTRLSPEEVMITEMSARVAHQLDHLVEELTERIPLRLSEQTTVTGYTELLDRQRAVEDRIRYLNRIAQGMPFAHPETLHPDRVGFGSRVRVEDLATRELLDFTVMIGDGLDLDAGEVSIGSPVAQALLGRMEGDTVDVFTPQRKRRLKIFSITTVFDVLGSRGDSAADERLPTAPFMRPPATA